MNTFLPSNDLDFIEAFRKLSNLQLSSYIQKISLLICNNNLNKQRVDNILKEYNIKKIEDIKEEILDLLLMYINLVLDDNAITEKEAWDVNVLKRFFKIKEGDFYNNRYIEIQQVLNNQFQRIYANNQIDTREALHKVGLQEMFDLGYDQFLEFIDKEVKEALERGASIEE